MRLIEVRRVKKASGSVLSFLTLGGAGVAARPLAARLQVLSNILSNILTSLREEC